MRRLDPLLALLLLLPAAWLALPATLAGQLEPELSATGWWVLFQIAPALVLLARTPRPSIPLATLFAIFVALSLLSLQILSPSDTLSSSRAVLCAIASLSALGAGSALQAAGRRVFVAGAIGLSIALTLPALGGVAARLQGALQNSGATSEAALVGALAALACAVGAHRSFRIVGWIAIGAYGVFVALAPALAGLLVFVAVSAAAWIVRRGDRRAISGSLIVFALAAVAAQAIGRGEPAPTRTGAGVAAPAASEGHLGGLSVRLSIAPRSLALFREHPLFGVGPGQFRASYPPFRDADERARSNRAAGAGVETEVEHAHNDYLTTLVESGILAAAAWLAMLVWLGARALRELGSVDPSRAALAAGVLGILLSAALRSPLSFNPASASLFFAAAGALVAREDGASTPGRMQRTLPLFCLALLILQAPRAWAFARHGLALRAPDRIDLPRALAACPDSPLALSLSARKLAADPARIADARAAWEALLELRPHNFEALVQAGVLAAGAGDVEAAREHWVRALRLAPERVGVLENLLLLEARHGDDERFANRGLQASGDVARVWAIEAGAKEMLAGDERAALRLWSFARCEWIDELPQLLYDRSRGSGDEPSQLDKSQEMLAHLRWAREHAQTGAFAAAVRSYRQALRLAPQARPARLELAAALWSDGKSEDAREEIARAEPRAEDWTRLAPWAGDALLKAGLFAAR